MIKNITNNIKDCVTLRKNLIHHFTKYRSHERFISTTAEANKIADKLNVQRRIFRKTKLSD